MAATDGVHIPVPDDLAAILREVPELRRAYLVGGGVRDAVLGRPAQDVDVEVFGIDYDTLVRALEPFGKVHLVGRQFAVARLALPSGAAYEFALARRESKIGIGHKGFEVVVDPAITPREAAARRDFTINALMLDPRDGTLLDFHGGRADLAARVLRHTGPAFADDPLRVLRGMQFAARFDMTAAPETAALCRAMLPAAGELSLERVRGEWWKWAAHATAPSAGLRFLVDTGWIATVPEVDALRGVPQEPDWHPEGDVFVHTGHCLDALVTLPGWRDADEETRVVLTLAVLAHDFGKPSTTHRAEKRGALRIVSPGHEAAGGPIAERFLDRIGMPAAVRARVVPLVTNHLAHLGEFTDRALRRLARRIEPETIESLGLVMIADAMGRPPLPPEVPEGVATLLRRARELAVQQAPPAPVLMGRHLVQAGVAPGPRLGELLRAAYDAQLDGEFADEAGAWAWLRAHHADRLPSPSE